MSPRMYTFTATVTVMGQVEAESVGEAERITEGVITQGSTAHIVEGDPKEPDDEMEAIILTSEVKIHPLLDMGGQS